MNNRHLLAGFICCTFLVASAVILFSGDESRTVRAEADFAHPWSELKIVARESKSGDLVAAKSLIREIIQASGFSSELRGFTASTIEDRVGRAESRYRLGQGSAITEARIARTVNGLVLKFSLPQYARTSTYEVRRLRLELLPHFPEIVSVTVRSAGSSSVGSQMTDSMGPAEAFFLLSMLLQQKLNNPDYQLTHLEIVQRWPETHNHGSTPSNRSAHPARERSDGLRSAIRDAANRSGVIDALQLSTLALNTLGIEQ